MSALTFAAGAALPEKTMPAITQERLRDYASSSGDPNPIHLDEAVARRMGLPGVIAHGMLIAGFLAERALELGAADAGGRRELAGFQIRFKAMTLLGDTLKLQGSVKSAEASRAILDLQAVNQRGETAATATATLRA